MMDAPVGDKDGVKDVGRLRYTGINHLAMVTGDMDATIRFWRDLLEMRLVAGLGRKGYRHYFFEISETDMIAFFEWPDVEKIPERDHGVPIKGPVAFDHIAFGVEKGDDLWALKDRLEAAGFWVSEVIDHGFIHSIYTFDPNHIPIEFSTPIDGIDLRRQPKMLDRYPTAITKEGPNPVDGRWPAVKQPTALKDQTVYPGEGMAFAKGEK
jgi:catechol 2,3-dioxygenase-like lactoylglutathione lyase family enzyme